MSNRLHSVDHSPAVQSEHLPTSSYIYVQYVGKDNNQYIYCTPQPPWVCTTCMYDIQREHGVYICRHYIPLYVNEKAVPSAWYCIYILECIVAYSVW